MAKKNSKLKWSLLSGILTLWLLGAIGIGMQVAANSAIGAVTPGSPSQVAQVVSSVFTVFGGLSVILTLYFSIWTSIESRHSQVVENTYQLIRSWDDAPLLAARKFTRSLADQHHNLTPNDLVSKINADEDLRQSIVQVLNFIEIVSYSLTSGRVDEFETRDHLKEALVGIYERVLPWIRFFDNRRAGYSREMEEVINVLRGN